MLAPRSPLGAYSWIEQPYYELWKTVGAVRRTQYHGNVEAAVVNERVVE
jgi:hypothetical protein